MSERAAPFYCPYCGDEDLRPSEAGDAKGKGAAWECASCNRAFALSFLGLLASGLATTAATTTATTSAPATDESRRRARSVEGTTEGTGPA